MLLYIACNQTNNKILQINMQNNNQASVERLISCCLCRAEADPLNRLLTELAIYNIKQHHAVRFVIKAIQYLLSQYQMGLSVDQNSLVVTLVCSDQAKIQDFCNAVIEFLTGLQGLENGITPDSNQNNSKMPELIKICRELANPKSPTYQAYIKHIAQNDKHNSSKEL